jgi:hypothetical protein
LGGLLAEILKEELIGNKTKIITVSQTPSKGSFSTNSLEYYNSCHGLAKLNTKYGIAKLNENQDSSKCLSDLSIIFDN